MLVRTKYPLPKSGVGAVREPPLRVLAAGPLFPARGRGKSLGAYHFYSEDFLLKFLQKIIFPLQGRPAGRPYGRKGRLRGKIQISLALPASLFQKEERSSAGIR